MQKIYYVRRESGYIAGWFDQDDFESGRIHRFMQECVKEVPNDHPKLYRQSDHDWDGILGEGK